MNKKQIAITLGVMCVLLTSGIIIQINTIKKNSISNSIKTSNNDLRDEVLKWKEKYEKTYYRTIRSERRHRRFRQGDELVLREFSRSEKYIFGFPEE